MPDPLFKKVLIANRGEIAVRIIRACREMGICPVAVFSEVDRTARHVLEAEEAYRLHASSPRQAYLDIQQMVEIARKSGSAAIHPGYGFLSENSEFAEYIEKSECTFIGPPSSAIRAMGNKVKAREKMRKAGVAVTPGSEGAVADEKEASHLAKQIGFPVLLKAVAGGGGKGMRRVTCQAELAAAFRAVRSEAESAFGNADLFMERFVERPRHIEVQILADAQGRTIHLGERECSIQRRHQKLVEESPSPAVDGALRARLGEMAVRAAEAVEYRNAGTVEFIMDAAGEVFFMEMNTRLQVEHPVTEMVTGIDLVQAQIRIAAGRDPGVGSSGVQMRGAAIECRIYAEDPRRNFLPSPGRVETYRPPSGPGVREEAGIYEGYTVPLDYDPLMAKLITWGQSRQRALDRMLRALGEYRVSGVESTIPFHRALMRHPDFRAGRFDTGFVEEHLLGTASEEDAEPALERAAEAAAVIAALECRSGSGAISRGDRVRDLSAWKRAVLPGVPIRRHSRGRGR
ncbi:MAG: acetyl-CoA carboxylase biotin carboxylase subunit [Acidobacteriota bacterium]